MKALVLLTAAACAGSCCAKAEPEHSGVVLAAASAATKKPAQAFPIPRPQNPTIRQQRRTVGRHNPQSLRITKSRLNLEGSSLM